MWRRQRGQFCWEEFRKRLILESGQTKWGGGLICVRRVQFFPTSDLQINGAFVTVFNDWGRDEFCREKTTSTEKQFPILEVTSRVNSVVIEVG